MLYRRLPATLRMADTRNSCLLLFLANTLSKNGGLIQDIILVTV